MHDSGLKEVIPAKKLFLEKVRLCRVWHDFSIISCLRPVCEVEREKRINNYSNPAARIVWLDSDSIYQIYPVYNTCFTWYNFIFKKNGSKINIYFFKHILCPHYSFRCHDYHFSTCDRRMIFSTCDRRNWYFWLYFKRWLEVKQCIFLNPFPISFCWH